MPTERRLAAILFTDVVGSTALMARSEQAGLRAKHKHRELVRAEVAPKRKKTQYVTAVSIATRYAHLGHADSAFEWFDPAYQERDAQLVWVFNLNSSYDPIRDDPRFGELAKRVGIPVVAPDGPLAASLPD